MLNHATMALFVASMFATSCAQKPYDPIPSSAAVVVFQNARFTILSDAMLRMELSDRTSNSSSKNSLNIAPVFEDRPSLAFVNRKLPVPHFEVSHPTTTSIVIETSAYKLSYTPDAAPPPSPPLPACSGVVGHDADCGGCCQRSFLHLMSIVERIPNVFSHIGSDLSKSRFVHFYYQLSICIEDMILMW